MRPLHVPPRSPGLAQVGTGLDEPDPAFREFLATGSPAALARVFDRVAPELLLLARQLAVDSHAAEDLVQATFLTAIEHAARFDRARRVVPWLAGILANHAKMQVRRDQRRLDARRAPRERAIDAAAEAERREAAAAFKTAIDALPEPYRDVVRLGLLHDVPTPAIAEALGRPHETVKTQLRRGRRLLEQALPAGLAPVVVLALVRGRGLAAVRQSVLEPPTAPVARVPGAIKVTASMGLLAVAIVWTAWAGPHAPADEMHRVAATPRAAEPFEAPGPAAASAPVVPTDRAAASLHVRCVWAEDSQPAAGLRLTLRPLGPDSWFDERYATSDRSGEALFTPTEVGKVLVKAAGGGSRLLALRAGAQETVLEIPRGVRVRGTVVDVQGRPVAGASVYLAEALPALEDSQPVAQADASGRFCLRHVQPRSILFARDGDRVPAAGCVVLGAVGAEVEVRLQFRGSGGTLRGRVLGPDGHPAPGARVLVGWGAFYLTPANTIEPPLATIAAADGSYEVAGLRPAGNVPIWVRARGTAVAKRVVEVREGQATTADVYLSRPATIRGVVRAADGKLVPRARVTAWRAEPRMSAAWYQRAPAWGGCRVATSEDGSYRLIGLPEGTVEVRVEDERHGRARTELSLGPGDEREWSPYLAAGQRLFGTLRAESGAPLEGWQVRAHVPHQPDLTRLATVDVEGRFELGPCLDLDYTVRVRNPRSAVGRPEVEHRGVRPGREPLDIVVPEARLAAASIEGRVRGTLGEAMARFEVELRDEDDAKARTTGEAGRFRAGPLPSGRYWCTAVAEGLGWLVLGRIDVPSDAARSGVVDAGEHRFARPGRVHVVCRDGEGDTLEKLAVELEDGPLLPLLHAHDGEVRADLQPGRYRATAWDDRFVMARVPFTIRSGEATRVELPLARGRRASLDWDPVSSPTRVVVEWRSKRGELLLRQLVVRSEESPDHEPRAFAPGGYVVGVTDAAGRSASHEFEIPIAAGQQPPVIRVPIPVERR